MKAATFVSALAPALILAGCVGSGAERPARTSADTTRDGGYVVRRGDTLLAIAARAGVPMLALARANGLAPPYLIRVGQRLAVPRGTSGNVRPESRAVVPPPPPPPVYAPPPRPAEYRSAPALPSTSAGVLPGAPRLGWPADGPVADRFEQGDRRGIGIAAHPGTAVRSAAGGAVLFAGDDPARRGRLVLVDHGGGWVTAYANLGKLVVVTGERVPAGARLGFVGDAGAGGTPQLRFELRHDDRPLDPLPLLPPRL